MWTNVWRLDFGILTIGGFVLWRITHFSLMHHCDCTCSSACMPMQGFAVALQTQGGPFSCWNSSCLWDQAVMEVSWKHFAQCYHILRCESDNGCAVLFFLACLCRDNTQCRCIMFCDSGMMHWDCLVYVTFKHAHYAFLQTCFILQVFYAEYGGTKKLSEHKRAVSEE